MKNTTKLLAVVILLAVLFLTVSAAANPGTKCKVTVNGQTADWKLEPFQAYGPQGNVMIMIPMKDFFTTLGYTVVYDSKLNRSVFTADKNSDYGSFYIDLKTMKAVEEGGTAKKDALECVYLVNDTLYVVPNDYFSLDMIAKSFLNDATIKVEYEYVYTKHEDFITDYRNYFPVQSNLSSLKIEVSEKYSDHPYIGEQYTKYNTGEWVSGAEVKCNFNEVTLRSLWDGFGNLHFYTGKGEKNELTGKGRWNSTAYAIAWDLMDSMADEINKLRKQNGLLELSVDHSICFVSVGAKNTKVDSVFDNAIHNFENNTAEHTYNGKTKAAECLASVRLNGEEIIFNQKYDNSTSIVARNTVNAWYKSVKGHKEIIMGAKYKTMGILVVITDTGTGDAYAVFQ